MNIASLTVTCDSCGKTAETWDFQNPDRGLECNCCRILHDHAGRGCRTITITGNAYLTLFDIGELLEGGSTHGDVRSDDSRELAERDSA